jgi:flagellar motility protein MotE (MotC chaperone)
MYRKLAISGVSILAIMTLIASAQQPAPERPAPISPPSVYAPPAQAVPYWDGTQGSYTLRVARGEEGAFAQKTQELVKQLAKAEGEKREKIKDQLTDTLGKQFDARQKRHQDEIAALEKQLKKLKELVEKRKENRREIIGKRLEQLVREAEGLGW